MRPKVRLRLRERVRARRDEVDQAAARGLEWLVKEQNARGFWNGAVGTKRGNGYQPTRSLQDQKRLGAGHVGVTAMCGMAFLSGGHLPTRGKYRAVVRKAVAVIVV